MITKSVSTTGGVSAGTDLLDQLISIALAPAATLLVGTPICRDITAIPAGLLPRDAQPSQLFYNAQLTDAGVLATSANAGDILGCFQGLQGQNRSLTNTGSTTARFIVPVRRLGIGRVLAGAVAAGSAVNVGSALLISNANVFATVGTRAIGKSVGIATAYTISTSVAAAIASGAQTVTPGSMAGIIVGSILVIDSGATQENVTVTAIAATTFTATFASAHAAGTSVKGITSTPTNAILAVPGSGSNSAVIFADINALA